MLPVLLLAFQLAVPVQAAPTEPALAPGAIYRPDIPTLASVVGHEPGERITTPEEITQYLQALHAAAPTRTALVRYGTSWENRPLWLFVVGSAERIGTLERVKADLRRLADPRSLTTSDANRLIRELPVVTWLMHGVHGNELSASDAALAEAYHLLAATGNAEVETILRESIVVIDPMQNPDGRARFVAANLLGAGASADANPLAAEHDEPWPGGRSNHYLFDMNRDWFAQSQPETRGRVRTMLEWFPHVVADLHEMSGESTYYFAPPANPINPHVTVEQRAVLDVFGRANAARFDARGFAYFVRETYDAFYPGYGESWPVFHGAIGMTYEQASARGLRWQRSDDQVLTYRDGVVHHFTAAMTTALTAATNRERLLRGFLAFRRTAISDGERGEIREYVLVPGADASRARRLARLLSDQGIEVRQTVAATTIGPRRLPAGAFIVSTVQPAARLVRNLLDAQTEPDSVFVREQERRRRLQLPAEAYDVTAWSLPLLYDVEVIPSTRALSVPTTPLTPASQAVSPLPVAKVGYVLPWGNATAAVVADALRRGIRVRHASRPFTLEGRNFPAGSAVVRVSENNADLALELGRLVTLHEAEAVPAQTGYQDEGISLGSVNVVALKAPRVLMAWDAPTSTLSAGWARYALEQRYHVPTTIVRVSSLPRLELDAFTVVILPSADYGDAAGEDFPRRLREWVRRGGTLITLADASVWAASVGLLETRVEDPPRQMGTDSLRASSSGRGSEVNPVADVPVAPGSILRVEVDQSHWLAAGQDGDLQVLVEGQRVFVPIGLDHGRNVGLYAAPGQLLASGLLWDEARARMAEKAFLIDQSTGEGHVIAFSEDPNYRAFTEATALFFINAVLLGQAY